METRTVWHPKLPADDLDRYRNVPTSDEERTRYALYYDQHGMLRERRGGHDGSKEWGAEVYWCRDCGRFWTDPREAHCVQCHRHFGSDRAYDRHSRDLGLCRDPRRIPSLVMSARKYGPTWVRGDHPDSR